MRKHNDRRPIADANGRGYRSPRFVRLRWRIIDRRIATDIALCLVGFIAKNHGSFEVMVFLDPVERAVFPTLAGAMSYFVNSSSNILDCNILR
ncbi:MULTISPECIES: hypothetical protein [unclassified Cryobacterium]|uniref:hypothetical protein n=1 Tax=unclassified Cryobacterium TaxID=2649013 RepID=UPI002AB54A44|nr:MULTISPECIES: hypothetical protein [unclassified Cryobacterium]MEB0004687.1 hypothetical protein [Cryobacterium sp. RTC2.1]MEB0305722.1 hypothetical protein [Cryobacterium sp. 10I1]MDY7526386.1 hypothetical protein [Cryobacterium sp. 10C2]MEB0203433.1 hypothetical protein [Cryobacterium sp. 5I3]WPX13846.1 hypothetical protein RHM57_00265 [Cryobacterium sp. 10S3]